MRGENLQKTLLLKNTLRTLGSIRDWFTKTFKGKSMLLNRLTYPRVAVREDIGALISARQILPPYFGYGLTPTKTGLFTMNITKRGKPLITMLELSTANLNNLLQLLSEIQAAPSGSKNSPKEASTSPQLTKKSGPTSIVGSDSELRKFPKDLRYYPVGWCRECQALCDLHLHKGSPNSLSLIIAPKRYVNLKPTA